jgi:hypothetical protein
MSVASDRPPAPSTDADRPSGTAKPSPASPNPNGTAPPGHTVQRSETSTQRQTATPSSTSPNPAVSAPQGELRTLHDPPFLQKRGRG